MCTRPGSTSSSDAPSVRMNAWREKLPRMSFAISTAPLPTATESLRREIKPDQQRQPSLLGSYDLGLIDIGVAIGK